MAKKNYYWKAQKKALVNSFRNIANKQFFKSALFDLLTVIALLIIINLGFYIINIASINALPELANVYSAAQTNSSQALNQAVADYAPALSRVLWISFITLILVFVLCTAAISFFQGRAWSTALKKKPAKGFFRKYFTYNLTWYLAWLVILLITSNALVVSIAALLLLIEMLLFLYLDPLLRALFDDQKKLRHNWSDFFRAAKKINWFVFYMLMAIIILLVILIITGFLAGNYVIFSIVSLILFIFFIGWARNYIVVLSRPVKQKTGIK